MTALDARNIGARYGSRTILSGVDIAAAPGEIVGLIGPNGAGKSTLLRILANLATPDSGEVRYDGKSASDLGFRALARLIAYLPQGATVHWPMRVETLVALGRLPHRSHAAGESAADHAAVERALAVTGTTALRHRAMGEISAGERTLVLLARALAVEAQILLADEPITALDPRHQLDVMDTLRDAAQQGRALVIVLHDLNLAARFCDRLVLLAHGRVLVQGAPSDVLDDRHVADAYGVEVARAERDGVSLVVPWASLPAANESQR